MQTKQKIYEVAKILYILEGYEKVTNRNVAEAAGENLGLITYYFKNKRNIAKTIIKENYQLISGYLRSKLDVNEEPFLFNITVDNLLCTISYYSENYSRFVSEMMDHGILIDTIYEGSQKKDLIAMIKKLTSKSECDIEKCFRKFVTLTFPAGIQFQIEINKGVGFTFDEYFETMTRLFVFALNLELDDDSIRDYINKANLIVSETLTEFPHLKNPESFLFNKEVYSEIKHLLC